MYIWNIYEIPKEVKFYICIVFITFKRKINETIS